MATAKQQVALTEAKLVVDLLTKARALIIKGWCQGTDAQDKDGTEVDFDSHTAVKFCAMGAMVRVTRIKGRPFPTAEKLKTKMLVFVEEAIGIVEVEDLSSWNDDDNRKKPQVVAGFAKAVKLAKGAYSTLQQNVKAVAANRK